MKRTHKTRATTNKSVANEIIGGLTEIAEALERGEQLKRRFTIRSIELNLQPEEYTADRVRETRHRLNVSQPVFAALIGVGPATVQSWEQGKKPPSKMARRLLDDINDSPQRWLKRLKEAVSTS